MGNEKKLSVIIPVYNDDKNIGSCLDSILLKQSIEDIEVICVNDGSTDNSLQILLYYQQRFPNVIVLSQENRGLSNARNRGLSIARGEYVYFADSDDLVAEASLERLYQICCQKDLDVFFFSFESFGDTPEMNVKYNKIIFDTKRKYTYPNEIFNGRELFSLFCQVNEYHVMVWVQMLKREFLINNNIQFYDGILFEDNLFTFRVLMHAERSGCTNDICYYKRIRENSIVTKPECPENIRGFLITLKEIMGDIETFSLKAMDISENLMLGFESVLRHLMQQIHKRFHRLSESQQEKLLKDCSISEYLILKSVLTLADNQLYK